MDSFSTKLNVPSFGEEDAIRLLMENREIHHFSSSYKYLVCAYKPYESQEGFVVNVFRIESLKPQTSLPEVLDAMEYGGESFLLSITSRNPLAITSELFWDVFEREMSRKDSSLIVAQAALKIALWLLKRLFLKKS